MDANKTWWIEARMKKAVERLKAHEFEALFVQTKEEAAQEVLKRVPAGATVGIGGSITIRELGVVEELKARGLTLFDHWTPGLSREQSLEVRRAQMTAGVFLSSVNAVTIDGELVNVDGIGNRVNAMTFGPGKVVLVAGYNKVVQSIEEGIHRAKNVVQLPNTKRLNFDAPCAKLGYCIDCNVPQRGCRVIVIQERKPLWTDVAVVLVGEELGY
jgi:hypothetical protein